MDFKPIFPPSATRQSPQKFTSISNAIHLNLSPSSTILLGAVIQTFLLLLPISKFLTLTPAIVILAARLINTLLITFNFIPNPYVEGAVLKKTTVQLPSLEGEFGPAGNEKIAVLLLGAKSNHPMGTFAPDFPKVLNYLEEMTGELEGDQTQRSGFMGQTFFTRPAENGATEFLVISYWRSLEHVHAYAHGPTHRQAWVWWEKTIKKHNYIGFMHEVYEADKSMWESVFINFQPTLAAATTVLRKEGKLVGGLVGDSWINPLVEASGKLRTSNGRRGVEDSKAVEKVFEEQVKGGIYGS